MNQHLLAWVGFWRCNPHRFVVDYLQFKSIYLKTFQKILLYMMNVSTTFVLIASRGLGKTFLIALFCCIRCILYPGTKICIASGNRGQAINVLEKINMELMPDSENLRKEVKKVQLTPTDPKIEFHNGSYIKVVTAGDSARSNRANILIVDEFRMVKKDIIDTVLKKFLTSPRSPGFLRKPEYKKLKERNKEFYLSSAYFKSHWSYLKTVACAENMLDDTKAYFCCGLPYQLPVAEGIFIPEAIEDEMSESDFNEVKWSINISVLLKPIEPAFPAGCVIDVYCGLQEMAINNHANRGTLNSALRSMAILCY